MPILPTATVSPGTFTWLHLSDLHLNTKHRTDCPHAFQSVMKAIAATYPPTKPWHAVLFSGDLVAKGQPGEFAELTLWLDDLWKAIRTIDATFQPPPLLAVPGNHDVDRQPVAVGHPNRALYTEALETTPRDTAFHDDFRANPSHPLRAPVAASLQPYASWWRTCAHTQSAAASFQQGLLAGDGVITLLGDQLAVQLACINTTYLHAISDKDAQAMLGGRPLMGALEWHPLQPLPAGNLHAWGARHTPTLLMGHHAPDWLWQPVGGATCPVRSVGVFDLHLCGHVHYGELSPDQNTQAWVWIADPLAAPTPPNGPAVAIAGTPPYLRHGFALGRIQRNVYNSGGLPQVDYQLERWSQGAVSVAAGADRSLSPFVSPTPNVGTWYPCPLDVSGVGGAIAFYDTAAEAQAVTNLNNPPTGGTP